NTTARSTATRSAPSRAARISAGLYTHYEYVFFFAAQTFFVWCAPGFGRARKERPSPGGRYVPPVTAQ
ncbi:MAG: hypothetical protein LC800_21465, partial [Acidobacteria bacterium]|nr:hypothetical protein [Acidobacteriota bacterium]